MAAWLGSLLPSPRLANYVVLGAALWIAAALLPPFRWIAVFYDIVLLGLALADLILSAQPRDFEIWRDFNPKMNLGTRNEITLAARSRAKRPVSLAVRDETPESWMVSLDPQKIKLPEIEAPEAASAANFATAALPSVAKVALRLGAGPNANRSASATYQITPARRGDFRFGFLSARYATTFGLWFRQFKRESEAQARVYPDLSLVRRYELALREGKMRDIGLHLLRLRGRGTEFESLREYSSGDEYKSINWNASARAGKLISTSYEIERDQTIVICLDCGRMMTSMAVSKTDNRETKTDANSAFLAPETPLSKLDCAINATVLLSHVAASMNDAVGLLLFSDGIVKWLPPRKGRVQTGAIIEALYGAQPSLVEPDYQVAYEHLMARKVRRALVVTFTDIIDTQASRELLGASGALRKHHNALCVTIANRDVSEMAAQFPETGDALYEKAMAQRMLTERESALERLRASGVGILDVEASELTVATVNRYLSLKSRGAL
ncbi:DUF58 domain-containing protein [Abditibacterium utsteinense]|uniref:DUF58 domain-containing protein n=1 Tax=Abditibacterium utsteinense TaxID=1960156 RepID=UPI00130057B4|nr:DUF58 domain-containing protein [Abditibacterium utsteinense]